jgi:hypothetical protein
MNKRIKNEQWSVKQLISKIDKQLISKPQFQRKKKWLIFPKNENNIPNEQAYIQFLFDTENSVHAITFSQEANLSLSNIDGNNRINAIQHFMERPFEIFTNYLDELKEYLCKLDLDVEKNQRVLKYLNELSYNDIINFKSFAFSDEYHIFKKEGRELMNEIKVLDQIIENLQKKLKINETDNFDTNVQINVNIFEGYNTYQLCKTFEDINKYNSKLTETELLSCRLYDELDFTINDNVFKSELVECIIKYYKDKSKGEILKCFEFDPKIDKINAHDFMVGFQNLCSKKYKFIKETDSNGLSLNFKLYKALYGGFDKTFTDDNITNFTSKIYKACDIYQDVISYMFNKNINDKLFNKSCQDKIDTFKTNALFMLFGSIIGYMNKNTDNRNIQKSLQKCILYHFLVCDLKEKVAFQSYDIINPKAGGAFVDNETNNLLKYPENISNKLTKKLFDDLICKLYEEKNNENIKDNKRKSLKFSDRILMFYFYKQQIPIGILESEEFSIEHICPISCHIDVEINLNRTGNQIPIFAKINSSRQNRHINEYTKTDLGKKLYECIKDIIPTDDIYNSIVSHNYKKPHIINIDEYNKMCHKNEQKYKENFISVLFD